MSRVLALAAIVLAAACTQPRSKSCNAVCSREAECQDQKESHESFDEGECLDACAALERDVSTQDQVKNHAQCVAEAGASCEKVRACNNK